MDPQQQREILFRFIDALPQVAVNQMSEKGLDIIVLIHDVVANHGLVLYEMGNICEGVRKVLAGEDSPANLVAYIEQDPNIEEDNRPKIPALVYEIQQKIFDPVLPILKQAGFPIKEGRVPAPAQPAASFQVLGASQKPEASPPLEARSQNLAASPASLAANSLQLEPNHIRALVRIAAGTKYSEEELREAFEELPVGLRQSLSSVDTANAIERVAKKHLLHVDQMVSLASETGLVLLGLTHLADFVANLARRLRLPDDQAKEIARDISAEIFVKVRDALRGLHEKPENSKSQSPNPKQIPSSNIQTTSQRTTPAVSEYGAPFGKGELKSAELNAKRYPPSGGLNASIQTPYSPQAKWNTGDNILAKQAAAKEGPLSREEVLRGIENPRLTYENTNYTNQRMTTNQKETPRKENIEYRISNIEKAQNTQQDNNQLNAKRSTLNAPQKTRPQSESAFPPPKPKPKPEDFLDQKLQAPMTVPKEERRYTTDPYREPLQ